MKRTTLGWLGAAIIVAVVLAIFAFRNVLVGQLFALEAKTSLERADAQAFKRAETSVGVASGAASEQTTRAEASAPRLKTLYQQADLHASALSAAQSDDPTLWARSLGFMFMCVDQRFSRPITEDIFRFDPKISAAEAHHMVRRSNEWRESPPLRLALPEPYASFVNNGFVQGLKSIDAELEKNLATSLYAPVAPADAMARQRILSETRRACEAFSSEEFSRAYRGARLRWAAQGATGALLQNAQAGWTSKWMTELTDRDFELVERIVRERQPDGLARLLGESNAWDLKLARETEQLQASAQLAAMAAGSVVAALASCQLGVDDCSSDSPRFRVLCTSYGGCHQPDIASMARYILARDNLDPELWERETQRVVTAIYTGDLAALNIRRKTPPPTK